MALQAQTKPPHQVIVTVRDTDTETWQFLEGFKDCTLPLRTVKVTVGGVIAAMNAGLEAVEGDTVSITDDDAAPRRDWLERISDYFLSDNSIGGVGGRDWVHQGNQILDDSREIVGQLQWFGRVIGNHHLGVGQPREVDVLKGVNMSFRTSAIKGLRFDERMQGSGAQVHFELAFCLTLKRAGWKLIYDPEIAVNHYPAQRFDEDQRQKFNSIAFTNAVHNETLALLEHLSPLQRLVFAVWTILVGTREALGLLQWLRLSASEGTLARQKWFASMEGRWQGFRTWNKSNYQASRIGSRVSSTPETGFQSHQSKNISQTTTVTPGEAE
jgi:cellulose synthase/poly-beta-1,6-N-acetylglucosamine synthase-like glycosyltransferase